MYVKLSHVLVSPLNFLKYDNAKGFLPLLNGKINKEKSPYINFEKIIELENKYNAKSSFYFLVNGNDKLESNYNIENLQDKIGYIIDEGCEIGYHTGYSIYNNLNEIVKEKKKLEKITNRTVTGVRNHVLRFKTPESWEILSDAGFEYDTSYHYHDMVGFRNGVCHPFYPFNLTKEKIIDILEIPLIVSDIAFRSYMKINVNACWQIIKQLIDVVEKYNGVLTILWHNWTFSYPVSCAGWFSKEWTDLYEKILNYSKKKNAWLTNCNELYNYNRREGIFKLY